MVYQGYKKPAKSVAFSSMGINLSHICIYCHKGIDHTDIGWGYSDFGQYHTECQQQFKDQLYAES